MINFSEKNEMTMAIEIYEEVIGKPIHGQHEAELLMNLVDTYGIENTKFAMKEAIKHDARNLAYIEKILEQLNIAKENYKLIDNMINLLTELEKQAQVQTKLTAKNALEEALRLTDADNFDCNNSLNPSNGYNNISFVKKY